MITHMYSNRVSERDSAKSPISTDFFQLENPAITIQEDLALFQGQLEPAELTAALF